MDFSETEDNYEPASQTDRQTPPTSLHDFGKHLELSGCIERHKIHAAVSAEVASIEPVPVLEIMILCERRGEEVVSCSARVLSTSGWWARFDCVVCVGLGQHGAISPQTCARAPSRTENSYGYQLSCEISLKHKHSVSD